VSNEQKLLLIDTAILHQEAVTWYLTLLEETVGLSSSILNIYWENTYVIYRQTLLEGHILSTTNIGIKVEVTVN
jgi:hypothetical protein